MTSGTTIDASAVLAAARRHRAEADAAEVLVVLDALAWAEVHQVSDPDCAATWGDSPVTLAGEGAPLISEFCVAEFAAALGRSTDSGRQLLAHALEIAHRLPRVWVRVQAGDLPVWRARRIAEQTITLSPDAAAYVDAQIAPFAHHIGPAATERLVDEAIARFMPEFAAERRDAQAEGRHFTVEHSQVSFAGTSTIHGELDLADALDLEDAVARGARQLAELGSTDPLDVRRAAAVGQLARGEIALELDGPGRDLVLHVHLTSEIAHLENAGGHLLTREQVAIWCGAPESRIIVKPVIDLNARLHTCAYKVPERIREQVILRDGACIFPWCTRPARSADIDHITPYDEGGQTASDNLAPLCRHHHRLKTHGGWTYTSLEPGRYLWRSPLGYSYLRDRDRTEDLTAPPVERPTSTGHAPDR